MPYTFLTPVNMAGLEVRDVRAETVGALPGADSTQAGRYVYHSGQLKYCNGSSWIILGAEGAGGPPSGTASGDLSGSYPGPQIAAGVIVDADVNSGAAIATSKISGLDAALTARALATTDLIAGPGLTGGGTLAANRTFTVGQGTGIIVNADDIAVDTATIATKSYVDNLTAGLSWKEAVRAATTANITLSAPQTVDGVAVIATDRVLVKNQTTTTANGIYTVAAGAWVRATDADAAGELEGAAVFVMEGSTQGNSAWVCTTDAPITVGSTALAFAQFGGGSVYTAGAGLALSGSDFSIGGGTGITISADSIAVDTATIQAKSEKNTANGYAPLDAGSLVPYANLPAVGKHYAADVGAGTSATITHNLNSRDVCVDVYRSTTPWDTILCDVERTTVNTLTLRFAVAVSAAAYRCVVTGR